MSEIRVTDNPYLRVHSEDDQTTLKLSTKREGNNIYELLINRMTTLFD